MTRLEFVSPELCVEADSCERVIRRRQIGAREPINVRKLSETGTRIVYRHGNPYAFLFLILIPAGWAVKYFLDSDWMPVLITTFMGGVMFLVGASREYVVFDTATRSAVCTESFLGRVSRSALIPFGRITRLTVAPHYERTQGRRGKIHQSGFQLSIDWKAEWGGGGVMLDTFDEEADAMREAEALARKIDTKVERRSR
jgi:hypothetical protein